ncbi:MAG: hypothetical protein KJ771_01275 [Nanoarchaeota archaeon]|nr:hypothetical protein [Nanoarchaeota archaeon]
MKEKDIENKIGTLEKELNRLDKEYGDIGAYGEYGEVLMGTLEVVGELYLELKSRNAHGLEETDPKNSSQKILEAMKYNSAFERDMYGLACRIRETPEKERLQVLADYISSNSDMW